MSYPAVRRWLIERTSLEPSLLEGAGFETLVAERLSHFGGGSESAYVAALDHSAEEADRLTGGIAVPETWFFRYPESFRVLVDHLQRRLAAGADSLRMMSIGCASGEEPYGMAMAALHAGFDRGSITIDALDRSREALRRAAVGEYGAFSIRTEIPGWAMKFLNRDGERISVDPAVRALVRFTQSDAVQSNLLPTGPGYDVIFCRNVLIYLSAEARARLLDSICSSLLPDGLLFVGHAEPLLCGGFPLRQIEAPHAFAVELAAGNSDRQIRHQQIVKAPSRNSARIAVTPKSTSTPARTPTPPKANAVLEPTLDDARDLADAGRAGESETMIRTIVARTGPSAAAMELLGMLRMAANDLGGARVLFEQAVYLEPQRTASLLQLAMISEHRGDAAKAAILWDRARRASTTGEAGRSR